MVIVVPVMFRFACSLLCYVVLYSVIMLYLLVFPFIYLFLLVVHVDVLVMFMLVSMPCLVDMIHC